MTSPLLAAMRRPSATVDIVCAAIGVSLPLAFLPALPGVLMYADGLQALEIFGEMGWVFLMLGIAAALASGVLGLVGSAMLRKPVADTVALVGDVTIRVLLCIATLQGLKTWLFFAGLQAVIRSRLHIGDLLPGAAPISLSLVWLTAGAILGVAWFLYARRRSAPKAAVRLRVIAAVLLLASVAGLAAGAKWPLMETAVGGAAQPVRATGGHARPDVVLITVDTLSADHMSLYGYARSTTPRLAALVARTSVFDHFYANANFTTSSIASMLQGQRPRKHRVFLAPGSPSPQDAEASLLAVFHRAGYYTMAVSTNPWASPAKHGAMPHLDAHLLSDPWIARCNWDINAELGRVVSPQTAAILSQVSAWQLPRQRLLQFAIDTGRCPPAGHFDPALALGQAEALLKAAPPDRPKLLWVHLTPPHDPYAPPPPFVGMFDPAPEARRVTDSSPLYHYMSPNEASRQRARLMGRYDEAVRYVDDAIGAFVDALQAQQRFDSSLVVVTADHGESFGHDYGAHGGPELYDEVIHIPLLIKRPGQTAGNRIAGAAEMVDLLPTMADITGVPLLRPAEGRSLLPWLEGHDADPRPVFSMTFERQSPHAALRRGTVAMIDMPWKLHVVIGEPDLSHEPAPRVRLLRLDHDPYETEDLADKQQEIVTRMHAAVDAKLAQHGAALP